MVTGGTRGMGFETARALAHLGMHVIIGRWSFIPQTQTEGLKLKYNLEMILESIRDNSDSIILMSTENI